MSFRKVLDVIFGVLDKAEVRPKVPEEDKAASLHLLIEEQRRDYDYLLRIYERAGAKENVLLTAAFGIIAYLYYGNGAAAGQTVKQATKATIAERLFFPQEDYGRVIYIIAAGFFIYGLFKLMFNVFGGNNWETAYESAKNDFTYKRIETLVYTKERYDKIKVTNLASYTDRRKDLKFCFYTILISAIILIVIKTLN